MNRNQQNLTDHIREVLQEHEEPYMLGSWERFQKHKGRKNRNHTGKKLFGMAASVLLFLSLLFAWSNVERSLPESHVEELAPSEPLTSDDNMIPGLKENSDSTDFESGGEGFTEEPEKDILAHDFDPIGEDSYSLPNNSSANNLSSSQRADTLQVLHELLPGFITSLRGQTDSSKTGTGISRFFSPTSPPYIASPPEHKSSQNSYVQAADIQRTARRFRQKSVKFSLAYAPLMNVHDSQTSWGMGGGFNTDWNFAENLSLSSGLFVAQNQLKYSNDNGSSTMRMSDETMQSPGDLTYMQVDLVSLEIPLNLKYSLSDHFSVSAGLSSVAYLKEDYNYTFEHEQQIQVFGEAETNGSGPATTTVTLSESQSQSEPSLNKMDLAALYTFSIGYQHEIANRNTVSLEPFIKIPTGSLTSRDIKYTTGGIQMKIYF